MDPALITIALTFVAAAALVFVVAALAARNWKTESEEETPPDSPEKAPAQHKAAKKTERRRAPKAAAGDTFSHPWLASTLKGHSGRVCDLDFASSGKHLATAAEDRSLLIWTTKDFGSREHKSVRGNVELDHARRLRFAPDSRSLVLALAYANRLAVYKLEKKEGGPGVRVAPVESVDYPKVHVQDIGSLGVACNGRFIMTASSDTQLIVWDLKGTILKTIETNQSTMHQASVSPCGRFVGSSGFTPDVLVWEVLFSRTGEFEDVKRAFELKGHSSGVFAFDFNQDSTRMVSASKDGTWRLWDTDVRYEHGQDPRLIHTGTMDELKATPAGLVRLAMAPNGDSFALATGGTIRVFRWPQSAGSAISPDVSMEEVHGDEPVSALRFSPDSRFFVSCGDRHVRVFHNVSHHLSVVDGTSALLRHSSTEAHRERLRNQARQSQEFLDSIGA